MLGDLFVLHGDHIIMEIVFCLDNQSEIVFIDIAVNFMI